MSSAAASLASLASLASPRAPRDRGATEARIVTAVGEVLARDGFGGIGINAIAKQAGVDKVLIYRYFGGLPELLKTWGQSGQFWPSVDELLGDKPKTFLALPPAERYARFMEHFIDGLRARPLTLEILAAEVLERNERTAILEAEREALGRAGRACARRQGIRRAPGAPGPDDPAHLGGAIPAAAQPADPHLRRHRHPERHGLGGTEGLGAQDVARSVPLIGYSPPAEPA